MLSNLLSIFLPLIFGYLFKVTDAKWLKPLQFCTTKLIGFILLLMGISLAKLDNLGQNFAQVLSIAVTFFIFISLANLIALFWLDKWFCIRTENKQSKISALGMAKETFSLMGVVLLGVAIGLIIPWKLPWLDLVSERTLQLLIFFIGISLRNSGISLRQILLNTKGISVALCVLFTSLLGGIIAAYFLNIPINHGLAMASGFGWYSLAGILMKEALGPIYGGASFLLELSRELLAIILIPLLINKKPLTAIGYGGATSMDFTLPIIQTTGGMQCVPIAIVSGFILSLLVPVLMLFFISL